MRRIQRPFGRDRAPAGSLRQGIKNPGRGGIVPLSRLGTVRHSCSSVSEIVRQPHELVDSIRKTEGEPVTFDPLWATVVRIYEF